MPHSKKLPAELKARNAELKKLTFECVTEALLSLMRTKDYDSISVTEICRKAGVSRNTFYKSFKTKDNVFRHIVVFINRDVIYRNLGNPFGKELKKEWYIKYFEIVAEYAEWFCTIIRAGLVGVYMSQTNKIFVSGTMSDSRRFARLMWSGAIQNATVEWLSGGMKQSASEMAEICSRLPGDGIY